MRAFPDAPLFRDPIFDGASDPVVIWNRHENRWGMFYTNRRVASPCYELSYFHGTRIGIASSDDGGKSWLYRGTAEGLEFERGHNTFWAPEVIEAGGEYHMYVSYVQGVPRSWNHDRAIIHYTSDNLWDWRMQAIIPLSSNRTIDACVQEVAPGKWKMWYKDEENQSHSYAAESADLYNWRVLGPEITDCAHEGPNVFRFQGRFWMITDPWDGLAVYRSDNCTNWTRQSRNILNTPGSRPDDCGKANHADVVVLGSKAYVFYFCLPEVSDFSSSIDWTKKNYRCAIQVAELKLNADGELTCDRGNVEIDLPMSYNEA